MPEWLTCLHATIVDRLQVLVQSERRDDETLMATVQRLVDERARLRTLIEDYATSTMPFEQFLALALGESRAAEIIQAQSRQRELLEQWHERHDADPLEQPAPIDNARYWEQLKKLDENPFDR